MIRAALVFAIFIAPFAQALDSSEQAIVSSITQGRDDALTLLENTVNVNSGTMNFSGVKAVGAMFASEFEALGFDTEWVDGAAFDRAGHLTASYGSTGPRLLLIGHLDTVFATDSPFQKYHLLDGNRASGPGTTDMKGGNVCLLYTSDAADE